MANPVFVDCPAEEWKKVATDVMTGSIKRWGETPNYNQTYRDTGDAKPTLKADGVPAFDGSNTEEINYSTGIDVYLYALGTRGRVRVDL